MKEQMFSTEHPANRLQMLQDNAEDVEIKSYFKKFTDEEMELMKERHFDASYEVSELEKEKKRITSELGAKIKPLKNEADQLITDIRNQGRTVDEELYKFINHSEGRVGYYNAEGELITERPIMQKEKQRTIFSIEENTGTNDNE
ncbi:hypothetical protein [Sphingobacterium detergens]|uniref:hypothetical protein n=1 Tax=Sphingobacterium detergens TaxID=1145106 RepID=UPI003AADDA41